MVPVLLIVFPFVAGIFLFFLKNEKYAKTMAYISSVITLMIMAYGLKANTYNSFDAEWIPSLGARFSFALDKTSIILCFLNALAFPIILASSYANNYSKSNSFYGLLLIMQAAMMGVFLSTDALLFYFFWELALIPAYFLCSIWGGEKRIQITFKFFIYTFLGSLLMLAGILFLYFHGNTPSFAWKDFCNIHLSAQQQGFVFWLFFIAFAIKMPVFPFHTWQPDTYEQSPNSVTMVLSGIMVKMGLFGVIKWLIPVLPLAVFPHTNISNIVIALSVIGILYASFIAIKQDDIKRLIAYSSIAHIGLMSAVIFTQNSIGMQGVMIQLFNHGINVVALWIIADIIERSTGTRQMSKMGGLAQQAPWLAIFAVVIAFANVALPLTNAFVGEFLMFNGLFQHSIWIAAIAGVSIILCAVYTLNMVQKVFYGNTNTETLNITDINLSTKMILAFLVIIILVLGVYPQFLINLVQ